MCLKLQRFLSLEWAFKTWKVILNQQILDYYYKLEYAKNL